MKNNCVLILDGNNFGWQAFGRPPLTFNGKRTEVISTGLSMIRGYLVEFQPLDLVVVWDGGRDKIRMALYPEYKARKKELTEVERAERRLFYEQLNELKDVISKIGFAQYQLDGREADDVIFNLAGRSHSSDKVVISSDEDMFQILNGNESVKIFSPIKKILFDQEAVQDKFGIPIWWFAAYKAMVGDPSDNLPGIKGFGPAKAKSIIRMLEASSLGEQSLMELKKSDKKLLLDFGTKDDQFDKMLNLVMLKHIPADEIDDGLVRPEYIYPGDLVDVLLHLCHQYGLERYLREFAVWEIPFHHTWNRRTATTADMEDYNWGL